MLKHAKVSDISELKKIAIEIRKNCITQVVSANSGHTGGSLGLADIFTALFFNVMDYDKKNKDRFVLSNGHVSPVLYAAFAEKGLIKKEELKTFRKLGSRLQGHPSIHDLPELVEISAGSLGQGFGVSCGLALAMKRDNSKYRVYVGLGDGELQEGSVWEAAMFASNYDLDNLTAYIDRNYLQQAGKTEDMMKLEPLADKWRAFGWHVIEADGNDFREIINAYDNSKKIKGKPTMIIFKTIMGKGVPFLENDFQWHGKAPSKEQAEQAIKILEAEK